MIPFAATLWFVTHPTRSIAAVPMPDKSQTFDGKPRAGGGKGRGFVVSAASRLDASSLPVPDRRVLLPFDYHGVRVTGGLLRTQLDVTREDYLRIPNDDLLLGFRKRAGLPAPGNELGGWYSDDVFHVFGQILSGLARMYAATGDEACKQKGDALVAGWARCLAPDGYFYYSKHPNAPHYIYDKMVGGLVDMAVYAGNKDALKWLAKITGWAEKNLDRSNRYAFGETEWYTLSENLYRAYFVTGDVRYKNFAKVWEYTPYWRQYAEGHSIFAKRPDGGQTGSYHAYSHVNNLGGAALAYRVTGNPWYFDTIKNAYEFLQRDECFATGGFGPDESLVPKEKLPKMLEGTSATFETQCGTWAVFKLCKNLIALTGDAKYGDWIEKVAYNGIGATIPMTAAGNVFYYSDYNPFGGKKVNNWTGWTCCTGTRPMAIADVCDVAYFHAPDGIDVNLFLPSTATFAIGGAGVKLTQETRFPYVPETSLRVELAHPTTFSMRIRKADWFAGMPQARVNGRRIALQGDDKHWLVVRRKWANGDLLTIQLPLGLRSIPLAGMKNAPTAIAAGPIVLAFRADQSPVKLVDTAHLAANLLPSSGEPLTYRLRSHPDVLARPFFEYKTDEPYYLYLDENAYGRLPYQRMRRQGTWHDSRKFWFGNSPGEWCEGEFVGESVTLLGYLFDDAGMAEIKVDGKVVKVIDQYGSGREISHNWTFGGFSPGKHTIRITVTSDKNPMSKDRYINVAGLKTN